MVLVWIPRRSRKKLRKVSNITLFIRASLFCLVLLLPSLVGNGLGSSAALGQETRLEMTGSTMGPIKYKVIVAHHPDSVTPDQLYEKVDSTLERVNQLMSTYLPDSDVSRFNKFESTEFVEVDSETAEAVGRAIQILSLIHMSHPTRQAEI